MKVSHHLATLGLVALGALVMGCASHSTAALPGPAAPLGNPVGATGTQAGQAQALASSDADLREDSDSQSVLKHLGDLTTIGSTVDPVNGDVNPYGLDIARSSAGLLQAGDLVVCNFNDAANVQGTGTTIIALHPHPGASPIHIAQASVLTGCDALALADNDFIWNAAFATDDNPIFSPSGVLETTLGNGPFHGPFGQAFAPASGPFGVAAFYESNAGTGSIVRIGIHANGTFGFEVIVTGFPVNHGVPGSILGPSGLQYDAKHDRLYVVDGTNNALYAFCGISTIAAHGITVHGTTFSGPFAGRAHLIFAGAPLNGPISSALLPDGHLVLGNTLDPNGKNLMVEIAPSGHVLDIRNVDTGAAGAIFGMVASGHDIDDLKLYFNDDNANAVEVLTH